MKIALTGHRTEFFPKNEGSYGDFVSNISFNLQKALELTNPELVITGMCYGWDLIGAEKAYEKNISFVGYLPFPDFGNSWKKEYKEQLETSIEYAHQIKLISENYHKGCFHDRDRAMVDDCDVVFALLNPEAKKGGTKYTVDYSKKMNKPVFNFWDEPDWFALENL